jgi:hypothetical protein
VARGTPLDTFGASLVHYVCDPDLRCGLQVTDVATGEERRIEIAGDLSGGFFDGSAMVVSPDGRLLAWHRPFYFEGQEPGIDVIDLVTGTAVRPHEFLSIGSVAWSPDGQWLILATAGGPSLTANVSHAVRIADGEIFALDLPPGDNGIVVLGAAQ